MLKIHRPGIKFLLFIPLLFFSFSFLLKNDNSFNQDLGRHIKLGEIILNQRFIPHTNLFSFTAPDFPFINHHYLFEILIYLGQQNIGLQNILYLKVLIFLTAISIILVLTLKPLSPLSFPITYIFLHVLRGRSDLRPEIFSFLLTAITFYILERFYNKNSKLIYLLPVISLLWVNTHIYFPIGLLLQGAYLVEYFIKRQRHQLKVLLIIFFTSSLVTVINPNSLQGAFYPLTVFQNYGYTIAENQNIFLLEKLKYYSPDFLFVKISIAIIVLSLIYGLFKQTLKIKNIILCAAGTVLALLNIRSFPYLFFLSLPAVIGNFSIIRNGKYLFLPVLIFSPLLIYESALYLNGDYYRLSSSSASTGLTLDESARKSMDFVISHQLPQPIFNNFDIGSYIIYRGYPEYKVFVDGRPESYPKEFFQDIYIPIQSDYKKFKTLDIQMGFKTIIFSHTDQTPWGKNFLTSVVLDNNWKTVYLDDFMVVLVKPEVAKEKNLPILDLNKLSKESYEFKDYISYLKLSYFLFQTGNFQSSRSLAQKAEELESSNPSVNLLRAYTENAVDPNNIYLIQKYIKNSKSKIWW